MPLTECLQCAKCSVDRKACNPPTTVGTGCDSSLLNEEHGSERLWSLPISSSRLVTMVTMTGTKLHLLSSYRAKTFLRCTVSDLKPK